MPRTRPATQASRSVYFAKSLSAPNTTGHEFGGMLGIAPPGLSRPSAGSEGTLKLWQPLSLASFGAASPLDPRTWGTAAFSAEGSQTVVVFSDGHGVILPATPS